MILNVNGVCRGSAKLGVYRLSALEASAGGRHRFATYGVHGSSRLPEGPVEKENFVDHYVEGLKRSRPSYFRWRPRHMTRYQKYRALFQVSVWHLSLLFPIFLVNLIPGLWSLDELYYFDYFKHQVS